VIKIIYRDLSPGLHASAEVVGRHTIISLLPGLTPDQRRAALRRIRHSGRMGHGPRVPAVPLALALGLDRIKATTRTGAAVVRLHPAGSTLPVVLLSAAAVIFVLMATVSIHVLPGPKSSDQGPVIGGVTPDPASSVPQGGSSAAPPLAHPGHSAGRSKAPDRLTARQPSSDGGAGSSGRSAVGTAGGVTVFGAVPGQTGTGLVTATSAGSGRSGGSGTGTSAGIGGTGVSGGAGGSGSGGSGSSGSAGTGTTAGSGGSGSGTGTSANPGRGSGSGSGATSGSAGTGTTGSGSGGSGSGGTGSGSTGTGTGSGGTGSTGSGSSGTGSTGSGSGSSGGSGSGGAVCVTVGLVNVTACIG
jgi:hypothetical protein